MGVCHFQMFHSIYRVIMVYGYMSSYSYGFSNLPVTQDVAPES